MKRNRLLLLLALLMTAATGAWAQTGMTKGSFSVSATKRVHFSKGNLQLVGENTFQFAENQWDVFGSSQSNGHRDLFGWGSANNPDLISENNNDYSTFTDWGTKIGDGTTWRTLTNDEWYYLLITRTASTLNGTENARYAHATVNGVGGLILFPDNYTHPGTVAAPAQINTPSAAFSANAYDVQAWLAMESAGAVFLPHGGCRTGTLYQSNQPNYWSSTPISGTLAHGLNLSGMEFKSWFRFRGCSVRLVTDEYVLTLADGTQDAKNWTIASGDNSVKGDVADGLTGLNEGDAVTLTYGGRLKVKGVKAVKMAAAVTTLNNTIKAWTAGSYAVPAGGLTYSDAITVSGDVTLTLTDGETLTLNKGISLASGATLTIQGNGTMNVNGTNSSTASTVAGNGTLVLTSGTLTAKGGNGGGYGDMEAVSGSKQAGGVAINGAVTVSGGTLTATGGAGGSIGHHNADVTAGAGGAAISGSVTLVSGTLTATGGNGGNGGDHSTGTAGAGGAAIGGDLTVNGGTMTTTNGSNGVVTSSPTAVNLGAGGKAVAGTVTDNR